MPDILVTIETTPPPTLNVFTALLPSQFGNAGKLLATNGSSASWTSEPVLKSLRVTDGVYPYTQWTNTGAPTDKKRLRAYVDTSGTACLARINDAENVGFPLIRWDVNNSAYIAGPLFMSVPTETIATFSGSPGVSAYCGLRITCADASTSAARTAFFDVSNESGANVASLWADVATDGSSNIRFLTTPAGSRSSDRRVERARITSNGNLALGTTSDPSRLTVAGDIRLLNSGNALLFTDTGGSTPYMVSAVDGNFYFTGTKSDGTAKVIFQCAMRSGTLSPFQINAPLKIGSNGGAIAAVLTAGFFHTPATIAANGGVQFLDVTLTGADSNTVCFVECNGGMNVNAIILKANVISTNVVRVYWINPTPSSHTLTGQNYRVCAVTFV